jgi:hypothetical protein
MTTECLSGVKREQQDYALRPLFMVARGFSGLIFAGLTLVDHENI